MHPHDISLSDFSSKLLSFVSWFPAFIYNYIDLSLIQCNDGDTSKSIGYYRHEQISPSENNLLYGKHITIECLRNISVKTISNQTTLKDIHVK